MKKYMIKLMAGICCCFPLVLNAQDITDDADIKIEGISAADASPTGVVKGEGINNSVKLIIPDYSGISGARAVEFGSVNCQCFGETSGTSNHNAALFANEDDGYQSQYYPYIQIEPADGTEITYVAFKAYNNNPEANNPPRYISYGFSSGTGTSLTDADFTAIPYATIPFPPYTLYDGMYFARSGNTCVLTGLSSGPQMIEVPSDQQTIRIAASKLFPADAPLTGDVVKPWYLLGIYIWTNGTDTGISSSEADTFRAEVSGRELTLSETGSVCFYSVSGVKVKTAENIRQLSLNDLPAGLYVMKATSETGKTLTKKVAL
ncbi:MAG: T9SS type A sorting domain-containing protein [Candidatus Azobacteroides sp.]|nr:T9SS type A sorting domain-containing protein [Candidatus Azobacteroides sp.]